MKIVNRKCIAILFALLATQVNAQITQSYLNIAPTSPTVAELTKYVEIPVSYYTGVPNINIPLYTIQCGDIAVPISLSYHAGGITVDQVASWVGLGWSLNAGGVISKRIFDNYNDACFNKYPTIEQLETHIKQAEGYFPSFLTSSLDDLIKNKKQPDLYSYNFNNYSGQFFLYDSEAYNISNSKDLRFNFLGPSIKNVFDLNGNQYFFDAIEYISQKTNLYNYNDYYGLQYTGTTETSNASQLLSKIRDNNKNDSIIFNYRQEKEAYKTMLSGTLAFAYNFSSGEPIWSNGGKESGFHESEIACLTKKVEEIIASNGIKITFIADHVRLDLAAEYKSGSTAPLPKALTEIIIKDSKDEIIKRFSLEYEYFTANQANYKDKTTNYRLKLKTLKEFGNDNASPQIYNFSYYGEIPGEPDMPYRTSFTGHDYGGYRNGEQNIFDDWRKSFPNISMTFEQENSFLAITSSSAQVFYPIWPNAPTIKKSFKAYYSGTDLNPDPHFMHAYSLKEITYPLGGKRIFEYEPNEYGYLKYYGGLRIKKITNIFSLQDSTSTQYLYPEYGTIINEPLLYRTRYNISSSYASKDAYSVTTECDRLSYLEISSEPYYSMYSLSGDYIGYPSVIEKKKGSETHYLYYSLGENDFPNKYYSLRMIIDGEGKCRHYEYLNKPIDRFSYGSNGRGYGRGKIKEIQLYNDTIGLIQRENFNYNFTDICKIPCVEIYNDAPGWDCFGRYYYDYNTFEHTIGEAVLIGKRTTTYTKDEAEAMITEEKYAYNDNQLIKKVDITTSKGQNISTETIYPSDIKVGIYKKMTDTNMENIPIEVTKKVNGAVTDGQLLTYDTFNNMILPKSFYKLGTTAPITSFTNYNGESIGMNYGVPLNTVTSYTAKGKVAAITAQDGMNTVYIWGYNNTYPIAEIKNLTYAQLTAKISLSELEIISNKNIPSDDDWNKIKNLKTLFTDVQMSIFTYKPYIGLLSVTSPDEKTIYYDYNSFGQLKEIYTLENGSKNILKSYEYHFQSK